MTENFCDTSVMDDVIRYMQQNKKQSVNKIE